MLVTVRMLWGPVSPVLASVLSVTITWAFFCIGEILLLVNLLRVFLVMMVLLGGIFTQSKAVDEDKTLQIISTCKQICDMLILER